MQSSLKCPKCLSAEVGLCSGGAEDQYECLECGYIGPIVNRGAKKPRIKLISQD